jgi:hypothetical protein
MGACAGSAAANSAMSTSELSPRMVCASGSAKSLLSLQELMRRERHDRLSDQVSEINAVLRGHYAYYGMAGNIQSLRKVHRVAERYWYRMPRGRSRAAGRAGRARFEVSAGINLFTK